MTALATLRPAPVAPATAPGRRALVLLLCAGFPLAGLLYVAAYQRASAGTGYAHELFWAATAAGVGTAAAVVAVAGRRRDAALVATVLLTALLSLPKFLRAPRYFSFYDEHAHLRAARSLLDGGALFAENPLNRVVADYPGLHAVTAVASGISGGSVFATGSLIILAARLAGSLAVYLLAERLLPAPGAALAAVAVFLANPAFAFFDAQYAYESLAAPLVAVVLLLALPPTAGGGRAVLPPTAGGGRAVLPPTAGGGLLVPALVLAALVVVTHHGSSYVLAALLLLMLAGYGVRRRRPPGDLALLAVFTAVATVGWLFAAAGYTLTYIGPYVESNLTSVPEFLTGRGRPRQLFAGFLPAPAYERVAGFAAVFVLLGLFCRGLLVWWRAPRAASGWVLAALGSVYFASLPLVALRGDQVSKRLWEFAFIGLGPVCAVALWDLVRRDPVEREPVGREPVERDPVRRRHRWRRVGVPLAALLLLIVFVGGGVARSGEHIRFPGPYLPSADPRSMTADLVASARWLERGYGPGHRITGDRTLAAVFGSFGTQTPVTYQEDGHPVWAVVAPEEVTPQVLTEIRRARLEWIAVDLRTAGRFPLTGFYFDESEPGAYVDTRLTVRALTKFGPPAFRRVYDNGSVVLYQVVAA